LGTSLVPVEKEMLDVNLKEGENISKKNLIKPITKVDRTCFHSKI